MKHPKGYCLVQVFHTFVQAFGVFFQSFFSSDRFRFTLYGPFSFLFKKKNKLTLFNSSNVREILWLFLSHSLGKRCVLSFIRKALKPCESFNSLLETFGKYILKISVRIGISCSNGMLNFLEVFFSHFLQKPKAVIEKRVNLFIVFSTKVKRAVVKSLS